MTITFGIFGIIVLCLIFLASLHTLATFVIHIIEYQMYEDELEKRINEEGKWE